MKITNERTNALSGNNKAAKRDDSGNVSFENIINSFKSVSETSQTNAASPLMNAGLIGLIDEVSHEELRKKKKQIVAKANDVVGELKKFHKTIVSGNLDKQKLLDIIETIKAIDLSEINDPSLKSILDEIEIRAMVELEKISYS